MNWKLLLFIIGVILFVVFSIIFLLSSVGRFNLMGGFNTLSAIAALVGVVLAIPSVYDRFLAKKPTPPAKALTDIPKGFLKKKEANLRSGKATVIVPVAENQHRKMFSLLDKEEFRDWINATRKEPPTDGTPVAAGKYKWKNDIFYAVIFGNVEPKGYVIWEDKLSNDPKNTDGFRGTVDIRANEVLVVYPKFD